MRSVEWNPNKALSLIAVVADRKLLIINPGVGDHLIISKTDSILSTPPVQASIGRFFLKHLFIFCLMNVNFKICFQSLIRLKLLFNGKMQHLKNLKMAFVLC